MKTINEQETDMILAMDAAHDIQREAIYRMGEKIYALEIEVQRLKTIINEYEELLRHK